MEEVAEILNQGWHPTAAEGGPLHLTEVSVDYETYLSQLPESFREARTAGHAWRHVGDPMIVRVIDVAWAGDVAAYQVTLQDIRSAVALVRRRRIDD
jgi:hypothetical protein